MTSSAEFGIVRPTYKGHSARPEGIQHRALLTFVNYIDKCTAKAKTVHEKSITYGAKLELLCKSLQHDVPFSCFESAIQWNENLESQEPNSLKKHGKHATDREKQFCLRAPWRVNCTL